MLNIYLCEDNDRQRALMLDILKKIILIEDADLMLRCETADPHILLENIADENGMGLYFLDIDLSSDLNGLTLAQEIRKKDSRGFIVFVTTHSEMCYMTFSYKVEAMDFIIKDEPKILQSRIHQCVIDAYKRYASPNNQEQKTFTVHTSDKDYCIPYDEILFFETSENIHKVLLHTKNSMIEFQGKLKDIEPILDERFQRCHRSFLINKNYIKEIDLKERVITMSNDETCFASAKLIRNLL